MQKTRDIEIDENDIFKNDLLDRKSEIENLTPIVLNFDDPLVLALDSPWGSGKTTFVRLWQAYLAKESKQSIYFNAWETDYAEDPLIVLVSELDKWLKNSKDVSRIEKWQRGIKNTLPGIAKRSAVVAVKVATFGGLDLGAEFERTAADFTGNMATDLLDKFHKESKSIQQFKEIITEALSALPNDQKNLVIFIDELDRCRPTYAIELLERIKHLFSINRLAFVLSTDTTQISHSICAIYGNKFDSKKYLQRFIDLDYSLKNPEQEKYIDIQFEVLGINKTFENRSDGQSKIHFKDCFILLVKRFDLKPRDINLLLMRIRLVLYSIAKNENIIEPLLVSLLILRDQNKVLYDQYVKTPSVADRVIDFLCQGFFPLKEEDYTLADIIAYLIAPNRNNNGKNDVFESLIKPYRIEDKGTRLNEVYSSLINVAERSPGNRLFNITVERIELVHRINIEI